MRLFIAVTIPENIKQYAKAAKDRFSETEVDVKWVEYQNYHLTLKFLGEVKPSDLNQIKQQLIAVGQEAAPFQLSLGEIGFFPNRNKPRVIFLDIKGELEKIRRLGEKIDSGLVSLGFEPERNRRIHLTLGRFRSDRGKSQLMDHLLPQAGESNKKEFGVDKFYLMESILSSRGPEYRVQEIIPLNQKAEK